jgi:3-hydroxybutyryl-CoA dehydrogenase
VTSAWRLHHVGVAVADVVAATEPYVVGLGMVPLGDVVRDEVQRVDLRFLGGPDLPPGAGVALELVAPYDDVSPVAGHLLRGIGAYHTCYEVTDLAAALAQGLAHPGRVLGLHIFNPAPAKRLVELIAPPGCDAASVDLARRTVEATGKTVIPCPDRPGFIVNRCARPFYGEALALLEEGRTASEIDAAMLTAGYRIGPFALIDLIGADINLAATEGLSAAMGGHPRYHVFAALRAQVARGDLGRKTGRGFVYPSESAAAPSDSAAIVLRIEAALANEAAWLLAEGGTTAEGIDQAMMLGLNFPRGPLDALRRLGPARILSILAVLDAQAPPHLAGRYLPSPVLSEAT